MTVKSDNDEYDIIDEVGCGRFGKVVKVHSRKYDRVFAIKRSPKNGSNVYNESMYHSEVKYLPMLEHKNIVNVYDYFEDGENYNIVLEYCGVKTLHDLITENAVLPLCTIKKIFKEILEAITYAHSQNISHRDLKPCNICIDAKGNVKIVDWGFAIQSKNLVNSFCGTFPFAAPECIKKVPYNPCKSDMWSIGVSLYLAAFGKNPFDDISMSISISKALQCDYTISPNADKMLVNLIQGLLKLDPDARLDAAGALSHPFFDTKEITGYGVKLSDAMNNKNLKLNSMSERIVSSYLFKTAPPMKAKRASMFLNGFRLSVPGTEIKKMPHVYQSLIYKKNLLLFEDHILV